MQNQLVDVFKPGSSVGYRFVTELVALEKKDAMTIATSLHNVTRELVEASKIQEIGARMIHILVGDGVNTNAKAASSMWSNP